jgi:hypothetical protein
MAVSWQLNDSYHVQIFQAIPLGSYVIFDLWSAVLQPQVIPYSVMQYFSTSSLNRHDFLKKLFFVTKCVLIFSTNFLSNIFIIRKVERESIKNICNSSCQSAVFLVRFPRNLNFPDMFEKTFKYQVSWNSVQCTDGQTDMTELTVAFRNLTHTIRSHFFVNF